MVKSRAYLLVIVIVLAAFTATHAPSISSIAANSTTTPDVGVYDGADQATYFAFIEQARRHPSLYLENRFSPTGTAPLLVPYWGSLGVIARLFNLNPFTIYIATILLFGTALLLAAGTFARRAFGASFGVAAAMVGTAGGIGWVGALLLNMGGSYPALQGWFADWFWAQFTWAGELSLSSHLLFIHLLQLALLAILTVRVRLISVVAVTALSFILGILHPYSAALTVVIAVVVVGLGIAVQRRVSVIYLPAAAALGALTAAGVYLFELATNPSIISWYQQNVLRSPNPLGILLAYFPLLPFVVLGVRFFVQRWRTDIRARLTLAWLLLPPLLAYLPLPFQRRFLDGYFVPVGIVAAVGWMSWRVSGWRRITIAAVLIFSLALTPLLRVVLYTATVAQNTDGGTESHNELAAMQWVSERCSDGDVVLADSQHVRLWIPFLTERCRTDAAHHHVSPNYRQRVAAVTVLFSTTTLPLEATTVWRDFFSASTCYVIVVNPAWIAPQPLVIVEEFGNVRVFVAASHS